MSLDLEDHVFPVLEAQTKLYDFLGKHNWNFNMDTGVLTFTAAGDGRTLANCPVQILGSKSDYSNTWLWAWANEASGIPPSLLRWAEPLKTQARKERNSLFLSTNEVPLPRDRFDIELAIICTGFHGLLTYYACSYEGGCLFTAIESCPQAQARARDVLLVSNVLNTGIGALDFNHKKAVLAYLGAPGEESAGRFRWRIGPEHLDVQFDSLGRIARWETTLGEKK